MPNPLPSDKLMALLLIQTLLFLTPASSLAAAKAVTVPIHTDIPIRLKYPVYGDQLHQGELISVAVAQDVVIDQIRVFKQGDSGALIIDKSKHTHMFGRGGTLTIHTGSINDINGHAHTIQLTQLTKGDSRASGIILPIISLLILWPLAFCAFQHGDEALLSAGSTLPALLSEPATITVEVPDPPLQPLLTAPVPAVNNPVPQEKVGR